MDETVHVVVHFAQFCIVVALHMWHIALMSPRSRALCERAMYCGALSPPHPTAIGVMLEARDVLVHDFRPDLDASCAWLDTLAMQGRAPVVIAMLDLPASSALHALLQPQRRFQCHEILLAPECTAHSLAHALIAASAQVGQHEIAAVLSAVWTVDPVLLRIAEVALHHTGADGRAAHASVVWPSEAQVLRAARIGRGMFTRHAHTAGFRPALRFLHMLRVLAVVHTLRARGGSIEATSTQFGYASTATLRRQFRALTGLPPHEGRHLGLPALADVMRRRMDG